MEGTPERERDGESTEPSKGPWHWWNTVYVKRLKRPLYLLASFFVLLLVTLGSFWFRLLFFFNARRCSRQAVNDRCKRQEYDVNKNDRPFFVMRAEEEVYTSARWQCEGLRFWLFLYGYAAASHCVAAPAC